METWRRLQGKGDSRESILIVVISGGVSVRIMVGSAAVINYPLNVSGLHDKD